MQVRLQTKIFFLIVLVILLSLGIAGFLITTYVAETIKGHIGKEAMAIAQAVAEIPKVKENVGTANGHLVISPIAEKIRKTTQVEYIVVIDMNSIRYSHPKPDRIGKKFVGGDEGDVLSGKQYISSSVGTLGPSLRAFVPIYREGQQVGAVSVGVLLNNINEYMGSVAKHIRETLFWGLVIGFVGAFLLARNVKKAMFGLEPIEIATLIKEKQAILSSIREGIIAINKQGQITEMNHGAKNLLRLRENFIGQSITDVLPNTRLPEVLETGEAEFDQDQLFDGTRVLTNRLPIILNNQVVGAVASFRDMTEIQKLAEELTGVKKYLDALRAQSHDYKNRIHTIAGLLQLKKYSEAVDFIMDTSEKDQSNIDTMINKVKDPLIGGLLLGKLAQAKEMGIELFLDKRSYLEQVFTTASSSELITVVGNLIDNALEASNQASGERRRVNVLLNDEEENILKIDVEDWGSGIDPEISTKIFQQGFSTKGHSNKGLGLTLANNYVLERGGKLTWFNKPAGGVIFSIALPKGRVTG